MASAYRQRVADVPLKQSLASSGAVLMEGPKASGKTRSASEVAATVFSLDRDSQARNAAEVAPQLLLDAVPPVLIDKWQVVPSIWNQVRHAVDDRSPTKGLLSAVRPHPSEQRFAFDERQCVLQRGFMSQLDHRRSLGIGDRPQR